MRSVLLLAVLLAGCATGEVAKGGQTPVATSPPRVWQTPLPTQDLRGQPLTIRPEDAAACQREANDQADGSMPPPPGSGWYALGAIGGAIAASQARPFTAEEIAAHQEKRYGQALTACLRGRSYFL